MDSANIKENIKNTVKEQVAEKVNGLADEKLGAVSGGLDLGGLTSKLVDSVADVADDYVTNFTKIIPK